MTVKNPSDFIESHLALASAIPTGTEHLTAMIDVGEFEYAFITVARGNGDWVGTVTAQSSVDGVAAATNILDAAGAAQTLAFAVGDDDDGKNMQIRLHGAERFFDLELVDTSGTTGAVSIWIHLMRPTRSEDLAVFTATKAEIAFA